jgi:hypothetical protein
MSFSKSIYPVDYCREAPVPLRRSPFGKGIPFRRNPSGGDLPSVRCRQTSMSIVLSGITSEPGPRAESMSSPCRRQPLPMAAVRTGVPLKVGCRECRTDRWDTVPDGLRSLQKLTRFLRTFRAALKSFLKATTPGCTPDARMEYLFVRAETSTARNLRCFLVQSVDSPPGIRNLLLKSRTF